MEEGDSGKGTKIKETEGQAYRLIRRRLTDLLSDKLVQPFVLAAAAVGGDSGDDEGHGGVVVLFRDLICGM
jgi:hypothetical protein